MRRACWWLVDRASQFLEPDERDAVRGDHAELSVPAGQALREISGLLLRRQAALWMDWRPWLALVGVVIPLGILLSHVSRHWAEGSAAYAWLYLHDGGFDDLDNTVWAPAWRLETVRFALWFGLNAVTLVGWSWTSGWVLGSLSRRTIWTNGPLFYLALIVGTLGSASVGRLGLAHIFSLTFYGVMLPAILRTLLVVVPALWGMSRGFRSVELSRRQMIVWAVAIVILTARAVPSLEVSVFSSWWPLVPYRESWPLRLSLAVGVSWPVGYMVAKANWRRGRGKAISGALPSRESA